MEEHEEEKEEEEKNDTVTILRMIWPESMRRGKRRRFIKRGKGREKRRRKGNKVIYILSHST